MRRHPAPLLMLALASTAIAAPAMAQPADLPIPAATTDTYPPGVKVAKTANGRVYADRKGRTLYGLDMRVLLRAGPDPAKFCTGDCATLWEPLLAPAGTAPNIAYPSGNRPEGEKAAAGDKPTFYTQPQSAPDWTVIAGPEGPQWVYKGWHLVYARRGDKKGSTAYDGSQNLAWNTLKFVPPVPKIAAPGEVKPLAIDGEYVLTDAAGRVLYTGKCADACSGWSPLPAGMAAAGMGDWTIRNDGDVAQWAWHGQPVYVSAEGDPKSLPPGAKPLRP